MGRARGGPEEARTPPRWSGQTEVGGCHHGHGGSRFPQAACPPANAAGVAHVGDDS